MYVYIWVHIHTRQPSVYHHVFIFEEEKPLILYDTMIIYDMLWVYNQTF